MKLSSMVLDCGEVMLRVAEGERKTVTVTVTAKPMAKTVVVGTTVLAMLTIPTTTEDGIRIVREMQRTAPKVHLHQVVPPVLHWEIERKIRTAAPIN